MRYSISRPLPSGGARPSISSSWGLRILAPWVPCGFFLLEAIESVERESGHVHLPNVYQLGFGFDYLFGPSFTTAIHTTRSDYLAAGFTGLLALAGAARACKTRSARRSRLCYVLELALPMLASLSRSVTRSIPMFAERAMIWLKIPYAVLIASSTLWIHRTVRSAGKSRRSRRLVRDRFADRTIAVTQTAVAPNRRDIGERGGTRRPGAWTWYDFLAGATAVLPCGGANQSSAPQAVEKRRFFIPTIQTAISPLDRLLDRRGF